jgi:nitrogen regulatory protein PII
MGKKKEIEKALTKDKTEGLQAPVKLKILVSIINREKVDFYVSNLEGFGANVQEIIYGSGTTPRKDILGIKVSEKAVLLSVVREDRVKEILAAYEDKYFQTKNGKGIAFTIPIKSMIGVMLYQFLAGIEREK